MNTELNEKYLLSLIIETSKLNENLTKKYLPKTNKLFESVFNDDNKILPEELNINTYGKENIYFVFESVKKFLLDKNNLVNKIEPVSLKVLNENIFLNKDKDLVDSFIIDLDIEIKNIQKQNDIERLNSYNRIIRNTILMSNNKLNVYGYNLRTILNPNSLLNIEINKLTKLNIQNNLALILFNNSDKELYYVFDNKTIVVYNILNNGLNFIGENFYDKYLENYDDFFNDLKKLNNLNPNSVETIFKQYITNNILTIFCNNKKLDYKFVDNLYSDKKHNELIKNQQLNKNKFNF